MTDGRHAVTVEAVLLSTDPEGRVVFRAVRGPVRAGRAPDAVALALAGGPAAGLVVHSTSWRWEPAGVVLTYAVAPDRLLRPEQAVAVPTGIAVSVDPQVPSPASVSIGQVAAHAVRHLAFVLDTDPVLAAALARHPGLVAAIRTRPPGMAGSGPF